MVNRKEIAMKKLMIVDKRESFLADVRTRMILDDERDIEIVSTLHTTENIHNAITQHKPSIVAVCENIFETQEDWDYKGVTVVGYALTANGRKLFADAGMPFYAINNNAVDLLDKIEKGNPKTPQPVNSGAPAPKESVTVQETEDIPEEEDTLPKPDPPQKPESIPNTPAKLATQGRNIKAQLSMYNNTDRVKKAMDELVDDDIYFSYKKTSVVTLYSAKGGVGKTTLATEIAVYLALTSYGRGNYRVCIVDYNIDFGDVQTTLDLPPDGPTMAWWAEEIRGRIETGEKPDDIKYTKKEIESFMQVTEKSGLYTLLAPLTHEDSMDIGEAELQIMLNNIIEYGEFDFVVCDTGNNTRDSSVTALEAAEYVLLVVTQDITAANCNDAVLTTLNKIHFDTGKIRLIINNVLPAKITGVAVQEIENLFPHPCIARIRHDTDVIRANNYSKPIVYQQNHEVTKEIKKIISFLTGSDETELTVKKGFLSRILRR
jgi:pilus assembly protein CpaE